MIILLQVIISIALIVVIMLQSRGDSGSGGLAGQSQSYRSKKGIEKFLFYSTIALAVLFASVSIIAVIL